MIVFLHGWLMETAMWDAAARGARDRPVLVLRQPAHGGAPGPAQSWSMNDWSEWAEGQIDAAGAKRMILVGHSMGGMLALALATRRPHLVEGLVLVGTTAEAWPAPLAETWLGMVGVVEQGWTPELAAQIAPMLVGAAFLEVMPQWLAGWAERVGGWNRSGMTNLAHAVAARPDMTAPARALGVNALVVHGDADVAIPVDTGRKLAALVNGDFVSMPGVGHCPPLEAPDEFARVLADFVDSLDVREPDNVR